MVSRAETLRCECGIRDLSTRKPQPHTHRRTQTPSRKPPVAGLLVRALFGRECGRETAGCTIMRCDRKHTEILQKASGSTFQGLGHRRRRDASRAPTTCKSLIPLSTESEI